MSTGLITRKCYGAPYQDCDGKRASREHWISRALLKRLKYDGARFELTGFAWFAGARESHEDEITARVLCARHNSMLHELDDAIVALHDAWLGAAEGKHVDVVIQGEDLARWGLKVLIGLVVSGAADLVNVTGATRRPASARPRTRAPRGRHRPPARVPPPRAELGTLVRFELHVRARIAASPRVTASDRRRRRDDATTRSATNSSTVEGVDLWLAHRLDSHRDEPRGIDRLSPLQKIRTHICFFPRRPNHGRQSVRIAFIIFEDIMSLRLDLGGKGKRPGQLTLPELRKLVQRAGEQAGFEVRPEVPALSGKMDFAWLERTTLRWIVAWELDGHDVRPNHIAGSSRRLGNAKKFAACGAALKVQALYSVRGGILGSSGVATCRRCLAQDVRVILDEDLMKSYGIEAIMDEARKLAGFTQLT